MSGGLCCTDGDDDVRLIDETGSVSVTVPDDWDRAVADGGWEPPNAPEGHYPALSVGGAEDWNDTDSEAEGVFLGLFPGDSLPSRLPRHPECEASDEAVGDASGDPSTTVVSTGCPGGVTVERVVQVASNRLLWVQVRSADRATANEVLDTVETHGL